MKLFDARPNAIHIFDLHIKQFLTASNIDFSEFGNAFIFCVTTLVHQTSKNCAGSVNSFSWKYETDSVITFLFIQMVFPSNTVISMRLPDSASIFTTEI